MPKCVKLFLSTFLLIFALALSVFAGEVHCPVVPPPPPEEQGRGVIIDRSAVDEMMKGLWEFLILNSRY